MTNDILNAIFELIGAVFTIVSIKKLLIDKQVRGVYWPVWIFYTAWGIWNLYYYPSVDCPYSFWSGVFMVITNIIWVSLAFKYRKN